jgi:hypothetical protein
MSLHSMQFPVSRYSNSTLLCKIVVPDLTEFKDVISQLYLGVQNYIQFYVLCTVHCDIIIQCISTKCTILQINI